MRPIALAMTGASGAQYGLRLLQCLLEAGESVYFMLSKPAQVVIGMETDLRLPGRTSEIQRFLVEHFGCPPGRLKVYGKEEWTAPVASGSAAAGAMVVCPCTTGTLAAIATGISETLIDRAADVMLKERRKLILVVRETPFSMIHLQNMLQLAQAGAVILPANPGFYTRPQTLQEIIDFIVARVLDQLGIANDLVPRWGLEKGAS